MKVACILAELRHSGAERMLACSFPQLPARAVAKCKDAFARLRGQTAGV